MEIIKVFQEQKWYLCLSFKLPLSLENFPAIKWQRKLEGGGEEEEEGLIFYYLFLQTDTAAWILFHSLPFHCLSF